MADLLTMGTAGLPEARASRDGSGLGLQDAEARRLALDVERSWIVEAPAGSGKTGLLIQRFLALLASDGVSTPEEVLAITFTKAAAAEIRDRVLQRLRDAVAEVPVQGSYESATRELAQAVLARDGQLGWGLLEEPGRLRIQTIDSLCSEIARALPILGGGAGLLRPIERPEALYREAARRTWLRLGEQGSAESMALHRSLELVLLQRDGDVEACIEMVATMLGTRDQWGSLIPIHGEQLTEDALEREVRPKLDRALERVICSALTQLESAFPTGLADRLAGLAAELAEETATTLDGTHPYRICRELIGAPAAKAEFLEHWLALLRLLVTKGVNWRRALGKSLLSVELRGHQKQALKELIDELRGNEPLAEQIRSCLLLPPARYPDDQWQVAKALFWILRQAMAELRIVFAERGECDFTEPALLAELALSEAALNADQGAGSVSAILGADLKHLLVDEMQDTSTKQYSLLERLTAGWAGSRRTVFLVGDPKQSIYLFRQARVERFVETMRRERLGALQVGLLRLTANFRSQAALVEAFNEDFGQIFPARDSSRSGLGYTDASAVRGARSDGEGATWHVPVCAQGDARERSAAMQAEAERNAREIRAVIDRWRARPLPASRSVPWRIAVLVANRRSLRGLLPELRAGDPVPFRATNTDPLRERREVLDLQALTRALLHPADRIAWLAVLHAPWCGLDLPALHALTGSDDAAFLGRSVLELVRERGEELDPENIARLERVWPILDRANELRGRVRLPELVERTWRSLGGDVYLEGDALENASTFLRLLRTLDRETGEVDPQELEMRLASLYAASGRGAAQVELMTIHGAKGLEWDAVIVPELERRAPAARHRLLEWEELEGGDVLLAPIYGRGEESAALSKWLRSLHRQREKAERRRVFYVACTRAQEALYLFGSVRTDAQGEPNPTSDSLLEAAWPAAREKLLFPIAERTQSASKEPGLLERMAASEEKRPAIIERLPLSFVRFARAAEGASTSVAREEAPMPVRPFARPGGSFASRAFGNAVHALLEEATRRIAEGLPAEALQIELPAWESRAAAILRTEGLAPRLAARQATLVRQALENTLGDRVGRWILGARTEASSELSLTVPGEVTRRYRVDRLFRAGASPNAPGEEFRWVIDYKTASYDGHETERFLHAERTKYADQMAAYARAIGGGGIRLGLWFPMMSRLTWWAAPKVGEDRPCGQTVSPARP